MNLQDFYDGKSGKYKVCFDKCSVLSKMLSWIDSGKTILDIGCADGAFGAELKKKGNTVYGFEISKSSAEKASHILDGVVVGNIEKDTLPYKEKNFDIIICADVLEHLYDPTSILIKLKKHLKDEGKIIISIPNIAHSSIRRALLFGRFEYTDIGLLDNSHIRFFTLNTAKKMIKEAGFKIQDFDATTDFNKAINYYLNALLKQLRWSVFPGLYGYQFLFLLNKKTTNES